MRLSSILDDIIDKAQRAFLPGRSMAENIFLVQELIRWYSRKRFSPHATIKIDLRNAFDTVDWDFFEEMMLALRSPSRFVNWVMMCARSLTLSQSMEARMDSSPESKDWDKVTPSPFISSSFLLNIYLAWLNWIQMRISIITLNVSLWYSRT